MDVWRLGAFTVEMSLLSTFWILPFGVWIAWILARKNWRGKILIETLVTLPLVLPPVATGLILLKLFGKRGAVGGFLTDTLGIEIIFTWKAVVLAMGIMSFPLLVRSLRTAFEEINPRFEQVAQTLGANPARVFWTISLPLARRGMLGGVLLAFARALGEFGATMMVAGNIPGETQTLALAIFKSVELSQDQRAYTLVGVSILLSFAAVFAAEIFAPRKAK